MKHLKKSLFAVCLLSVSLLSCGCEITIKNETSDNEYKEKYETLVSQMQSEYDQAQVKAMAKEIHTACSCVLTMYGIEDTPVPDNFTYENTLDKLINDGYLPSEYRSYDIDVSWEYNPETYACKKVTVTSGGITAVYPDQQ